MTRYIDVKAVIRRIPKQEYEERKKSVVHPNGEVTGKEDTGVVVYSRKANYGSPFTRVRGY